MTDAADDPDDVESHASLAPDVESLLLDWELRGVSDRAAWAMLTSCVLSMAHEAGASLEEIVALIREGWDEADRQDGLS